MEGLIIKANILIVDDEEDLRQTVSWSLSKADFNVTQAASAAAALKIIKDRFDTKERIEVLVTDLSMPGESGVSLIDSIGNDIPVAAQPIIIVVSAVVEECVKELFQKNVALFFSKPFQIKSLCKGVKMLLDIQKKSACISRCVARTVLRQN